ncbi:MAG: hypothetical protein HYY96_17335 [Candidatus Tectomicrobia bacterium]|nr:hypothetical protein [Candidatus Tectomicrobia bacterium]
MFPATPRPRCGRGSRATAGLARWSAALLLFLASLLAGPEAGGAAPTSPWLSRETAHFTVRYTKVDAYITETLVAIAESSYAEVATALGVAEAFRADLYVAPDEATFEQLLRGAARLPEWVAGVAVPQRRLILLKSPRLLKGLEPHYPSLLPHELSHLLLAQRLGACDEAPSWLDEGLAQYLAQEWDMGKRATLLKASLTGSFLPLGEITAGFPRQRELAELAYAEGLSFVSYLIRVQGWSGIQRLLTALRARCDFEPAFREAYAASLRSYEAAWLARLKERYTWLPVLTGGGSLFFLGALLVVTGYVRKRRATKAKLRQWEEEEQAARMSAAVRVLRHSRPRPAARQGDAEPGPDDPERH